MDYNLNIFSVIVFEQFDKTEILRKLFFVNIKLAFLNGRTKVGTK